MNITQNPDGSFTLAAADYQTLSQANVLIFSQNPDGTPIQITPLTATVVNLASQVQNLQAQETAIQTQITKDTAAEVDVNQPVQSQQITPS